MLCEVRLLKYDGPKYGHNDCHILEYGLSLLGSGESMSV